MDKPDYVFLTPAVARIAYEQIVAWQQQELKLQSIPDHFCPDNEQRLVHILRRAGIHIKLLQDAGICRVERQPADLHGSNWGDPWHDVFIVDMRKLFEFSQQAMPAPDSYVKAHNDNGNRTLKAPRLKFPKP